MAIILLFPPEPNPKDIVLRGVPASLDVSGVGDVSGFIGEIDATGTLPVVIVDVPLQTKVSAGGSWWWEPIPKKIKLYEVPVRAPRRKGTAVLVSLVGETRGYGRIDVSRLIERDLAALDALDEMLDKIGAL